MLLKPITIIVAIFFVAYFIFTMLLKQNDIYINTSASLPLGFYQAQDHNSPITKGQTVMLCVPEPYEKIAYVEGYIGRGTCPHNTAPIGKNVAATEGDVIEVKFNHIFINDVEIPSSTILPTSKVQKLKNGDKFTLKKNEIFLLNDLRESFDSRYFGPISTDDVMHVIKKVSGY